MNVFTYILCLFHIAKNFLKFGLQHCEIYRKVSRFLPKHCPSCHVILNLGTVRNYIEHTEEYYPHHFSGGSHFSGSEWKY